LTVCTIKKRQRCFILLFTLALGTINSRYNLSYLYAKKWLRFNYLKQRLHIVFRIKAAGYLLFAVLFWGGKSLKMLDNFVGRKVFDTNCVCLFDCCEDALRIWNVKICISHEIWTGTTVSKCYVILLISEEFVHHDCTRNYKL